MKVNRKNRKQCTLKIEGGTFLKREKCFDDDDITRCIKKEAKRSRTPSDANEDKIDSEHPLAKNLMQMSALMDDFSFLKEQYYFFPFLIKKLKQNPAMTLPECREMIGNWLPCVPFCEGSEENLGVSDHVFVCLLKHIYEVSSECELENKKQHSVISLPIQVQMFLVFLTTEGSVSDFSTVAERFAVTEEIAKDSIGRVCELVLLLEKRFVRWYSTEEQLHLFNSQIETVLLTGFKGCKGFAHPIFFQLQSPLDDTIAKEYFCPVKQGHFLNAHIVTSPEHLVQRFVGIYPGSLPLNDQLRDTPLLDEDANVLFKDDEYLIGSSHYPLTSRIVRAYPKDYFSLNLLNQSFNKLVDLCMNNAETTISMIKARFKRIGNVCFLAPVNYILLGHAQKLIRVSVILHNLCILKSDKCKSKDFKEEKRSEAFNVEEILDLQASAHRNTVRDRIFEAENPFLL